MRANARHRRALLGAALGMAASGPTLAAERGHAQGEPWRLRVPEAPRREGAVGALQQALLKAALEAQGHTIALDPVPAQTWARQLRELQSGRLDVAPLPLNDRAYADFGLLRVDLPLRPGLLGLRVLVARADRAAEWARAEHLRDLQARARLGYGTDWADRDAMVTAGFQVVGARSVPALYDLLHRGDCEVLSRGVTEVDAELALMGSARPGGVPLVVVPDLALTCPLDDAFHLGPQNRTLHELLQAGQRQLARSGAWSALLARHHGDALLRHRMAQRRLWDLPGYPAPRGVAPEWLDVRRWLPLILAASQK